MRVAIRHSLAHDRAFVSRCVGNIAERAVARTESFGPEGDYAVVVVSVEKRASAVHFLRSLFHTAPNHLELRGQFAGTLLMGFAFTLTSFTCTVVLATINVGE